MYEILLAPVGRQKGVSLMRVFSEYLHLFTTSSDGSMPSSSNCSRIDSIETIFLRFLVIFQHRNTATYRTQRKQTTKARECRLKRPFV